MESGARGKQRGCVDLWLLTSMSPDRRAAEVNIGLAEPMAFAAVAQGAACTWDDEEPHPLTSDPPTSTTSSKTVRPGRQLRLHLIAG